MFYLKRNLPGWERGGRLLLGGIAAAMAASGLATGIVAWLVGVTAATLVLTAVFGFCPACAMVGRQPIKD